MSKALKHLCALPMHLRCFCVCLFGCESTFFKINFIQEFYVRNTRESREHWQKICMVYTESHSSHLIIKNRAISLQNKWRCSFITFTPVMILTWNFSDFVLLYLKSILRKMLELDALYSQHNTKQELKFSILWTQLEITPSIWPNIASHHTL